MCMYAEIIGNINSGLVLFKQVHDINSGESERKREYMMYSKRAYS